MSTQYHLSKSIYIQVISKVQSFAGENLCDDELSPAPLHTICDTETGLKDHQPPSSP